MATITLEVPDKISTDIYAAVCMKYGYDSNSKMTQEEFVSQHLVEHIKEALVEYRINQYQAGLNEVKAKAEQDAITISYLTKAEYADMPMVVK